MDASRDLLEFAERLISVLEHGRKTATYKYGVLLGLMDLCLTKSTERGAAPESITTAQLAERVVELYWPHARSFNAPHRVDAARVLRQNTRGQAEIVTAIQRFREKRAPDPSAALARARVAAPEAFALLERSVEWKLIEMPLPKLQRMLDEGDDAPFLYEIGWTDSITRAEFLDEGRFDNRILLRPNVGEYLVRLNGLLRPMIERRWAAMITRLNDDLLDEAALDEFLFGVDRTALEPVRAPLLELQGGDCFYCQRGIGKSSHVDHFVPWARHPTNALDNLVVAHPTCNLDKSDSLVATPHLARWREHLAKHESGLLRIAKEKRWQEPRGATLQAVRAIYLRLRPGFRLWEVGNTYVPGEPREISRVLG